jgi:hypothetical protein
LIDPSGLCFVSYRRTRATEVALIVAALRDRGIPTWQDIADLPTTPTEEELRRVLADPATACAILFATPEVEHSAIIREVEAPAILQRHLQNNGFFVVPVAAGGLDYADIPRVLGPQLGLAYIPGWNIQRVDLDPIDVGAADAIADLVLHQRLAAIHASLPTDDSLRIVASTRAHLPKLPGPALAIDLTHRFSGRLAPTSTWTTAILPGFRSIVGAIQSRAPNRSIDLSGQVAIPAAVALGAAFLSLAGVRTSWIQDQQTFGKPAERWGLHYRREPSSFHCVTQARTSGAADIAVLVSVAADVLVDFNATVAALPPLRAIVSIAWEPPNPAIPARSVLSAGQALDVAHMAVDALRAARTEYQTDGTVHLFLAVPVGLAMMIGQLLNTFGAVQTYEHIPSEAIPYKPAALLFPSL